MAASSSSGISLEEKYEVFLSFRGEDTRYGFTSHLYSALTRKNVRAFIDDDGLIRGEQISPALVSAIERSKIAVVVFSARYASSQWCLDELVHIVRCKEELGQIVIPVFYHVQPQYVRRQSGSFGDEFAKLPRRFREKSETWRKVLTEVANLAGWDSDVIRHEAVLVQQIVSDVYEKLNYLSLVKEKELVGVEKHIKEIESPLCNGSKDVFTVGIWGIVGVGKSTIASVIYHRIYEQFDRYCFIDNVGERAGRNDGLNSLRKEILSAITLVDRNSLVSTKEESGRKKVFMVFDNVTQSDQIDFLIGGDAWFGPGSRIVIIARDEQVLTKCRVDKTYKLEGLLHNDALKLFNSYALGDPKPGKRFSELSESLIAYAKGAPLFLKLLGSFLSGKRPQEWEITHDRLKRIRNADFREILQICYDGLGDREKKIFSQILWSLNGVDMDHVKVTLQYWNNSSPEKEINALVNKHLITITNNKVVMHDSLKNIVRKPLVDRSDDIEYFIAF
ncbi:disease resistance protein RUN1-like [Mangifera indica]|uniref:disease resistance protein RUN1-like n=1 Tax=Mangifera indica TaxID=29780 RepID=UPI001CFAB24B|nr:disease resistance protein RUN1-like [Mangifera indica]